MNIQCLSSHNTCRLAAKELTAYLNRMGRPALSYELRVEELSAYSLPAPADPLLDDQYVIDVQEAHQRILGNNPRSLLLGVYRYLTLIGCRFLRPGKEHEIVPTLTCDSDYYAQEVHAASLRHRGAHVAGTILLH